MFKQSRVMISKTFFVTLLTVLTVQFSNIAAIAQYVDPVSASVGIGIDGINPDAYGGTDETKARRRYLYNLGSNDISAEIENSLQKKLYREEINRRQLIDSKNAYQVINAARELSLMIMETLDTQKVDANRATQLAQFAAKLIAMKPLPPSIKISSDVLDNPKGDEKTETLANEYAEERAGRMNLHKKLLIADIIFIMHEGRADVSDIELQRIDKYATEIIKKTYHGESVGSGEYLGTNLARLLKREDVLKKRTDIRYAEIIKKELRTQYNLFLENYIGDTVAFEDHKNKVVTQKVSNGDEILTRYMARGSLQISWAAIPQNLRLRWKARFKTLIGTPLAGIFYGNENDMEKKITLWMRFKDYVAQSGFLRKGFSHIGSFTVLTDPVTKEKAVYVYHNIPNDVADVTQEEVRTGGLVRVPLKQFINPSHHVGTYLVKRDPVRFHKWAMKSKETIGYQKEFFKLNKVSFDGVLPVKTDQETTWKTEITEEEFNKLHSKKNPKVFTEQAMDRYMGKLYQYLTERGLAFHWPEAPLDFLMPDSIYCDLTLDTANREINGFSLNEYKSQWHWVLKLMASVGKLGDWFKKNPGFEKVGEMLLSLPQVEKAKSMMKLDISAPNNSAIQDDKDGRLIKFPKRSHEQRQKSSYDFYDPVNRAFADEIELKYKFSRFDHRSFDPISSANAAMGEHEYRETMRASVGLKNPKGFSTERIAKFATDKAKPIYLQEMQEHQAQQCPAVFKTK